LHWMHRYRAFRIGLIWHFLQDTFLWTFSARLATSISFFKEISAKSPQSWRQRGHIMFSFDCFRLSPNTFTVHSHWHQSVMWLPQMQAEPRLDEVLTAFDVKIVPTPLSAKCEWLVVCHIFLTDRTNFALDYHLKGHTVVFLKGLLVWWGILCYIESTRLCILNLCFVDHTVVGAIFLSKRSKIRPPRRVIPRGCTLAVKGSLSTFQVSR
jgi:hypothetical protein